MSIVIYFCNIKLIDGIIQFLMVTIYSNPITFNEVTLTI